MNKRSEAAYKAHATRRARKEFQEAYPETCDVARELLLGYDSKEIAVDYQLAVGTVAAVKANLNRYGNFSYLALKCNY